MLADRRSKTCCLLPGATLTLSAELEGNSGREADSEEFEVNWDVGAVAAKAASKESSLVNNKISIGPMSLLKAQPTTSGLVLPNLASSQMQQQHSSQAAQRQQTAPSVSFSLNSPASEPTNQQQDRIIAEQHLDKVAHVATTSSSNNHLQLEPSSSAYQCNNCATEPTSRIISPSCGLSGKHQHTHKHSPGELQPTKQQQQQQQSSTFNAKFRVHSRHRSIGRLEDLAGNSSELLSPEGQRIQAPEQQQQQQSERICSKRNSLLLICATTNDSSKQQYQLPQVRVGAQQEGSLASKSINSNNNNSKIQITNEKGSTRKSIFIHNNKLINNKQQQLTSSTPNQLNRLKSEIELEFKKQDNGSRGRAAITMSQTLQSIHSLSMQLNQAASLRGSSQLDELEPEMTLSSQVGSCGGVGGGQGSGKFMGSNKFSRLLGKKASRVKELLLQNLGKADRTTDDLFKMYEENFYRQQNQALKLQKEFKSYVQALKGSQEAGKSLNNCIQQSTGDYQSARHDLVCENLSQLEHLDEDLMEKLRSQILVSVSEYLSQFNELRDKIAKRRRKLIDFDSSRRVYELMLAQVSKKRQQQQQQQQQTGGLSGGASNRSFRSALTLSGGSLGGSQEEGGCSLQSATSQLVDEARLLKLREQYNYCKIMYETINGELHEELPMVYEKKMKNLLMTLQNYFSIEAQFHSNAGKLFATASDVIDELPMSSLQSQHHLNGVSARHQTHLSAEDQGLNGADHCEYSKTMASGSSGMGSSGGDSSLESSSSLNASGNGSPTGEQLDHGDHPAVISGGGNLHEVAHGVQVVMRPGGPCGGDEDDAEEEEEEEEEAEHDEEEIDEICQHQQGDEQFGVSSNVNGGPKVDGAQKEQVTEIDGDEGKSGKEFGLEGAAVSSQAVYVVQHQPANTIDIDEESTTQAVSAITEQVVVSTCEEEELIGAATAESMALNRDNSEVDYQDDEVFEVPREPLDSGCALVQSVDESLVQGQEKKQDDLVEKAKKVGDDEVVEEEEEELTEKKCLYKVKTSYKYLAEDVDELCFEADEIIQVIEFDNSQEQEEGWLMGVREVNGQKGLFPANFTRPI